MLSSLLLYLYYLSLSCVTSLVLSWLRVFPAVWWWAGREYRVMAGTSVSVDSGRERRVSSVVSPNKVTYVGMNSPCSFLKHMNNVMYSEEFEMSRRQWFDRHELDRLISELNFTEIATNVRYRREMKPEAQFDITTELAACLVAKDAQSAVIVYDQRMICNGFIHSVCYSAFSIDTTKTETEKSNIREILADNFSPIFSEDIFESTPRPSIVDWLLSLSIDVVN